MTRKEYAVQYRFTPHGVWHSQDELFDSFDTASSVMENHRRITVSMYPDNGAKYWRVVCRDVTAWEEAGCSKKKSGRGANA